MIEAIKDSFIDSFISIRASIEDFIAFEDSFVGFVNLEFKVMFAFTFRDFEAFVKTSFVTAMQLKASFKEFMQLEIQINRVFPLENKLKHKFKLHEGFKLVALFHILLCKVYALQLQTFSDHKFLGLLHQQCSKHAQVHPNWVRSI